MMKDQENKLRAINFDLNIDALRKYFSESNPKGAYKEIRRFMESNGFEHRQWSGYCAKEPISNFDIIYYLIVCMKKCHGWIPVQSVWM